MYRYVSWWLAGTLAAALTTCSAAAWAQDAAYPATGDATVTGQYISSSSVAPDLESRIAALEAANKKLADTAAADKAKAAGKPTVNVGGLIQDDWSTFSQNQTSFNSYGNVQNGEEFRRIRLKAYGEAFCVMNYQIEVELRNLVANTAMTPNDVNDVGIKDTYIGFHDLPAIGNVWAGHFKEPMGLEQLTSDKFTTFMERSQMDERALIPARNYGVMAFDWKEDQMATWALGGFKVTNQSSAGEAPPTVQSDNGYSITGRLTYLPWYDESTEGRGLWHVGASYSYRQPNNDAAATANGGEVLIAGKPEDDLGPTMESLTFGPNVLDHWQLMGAETAFVYGPFSVQSEFVGAWFTPGTAAPASLNTTAFAYGTYVYFSYFLTGENRNYDRKHAYFDRVTPYENFFRVRGEDDNIYTGKGAWEIGYRWSYMDLDGQNGNLEGVSATAASHATRNSDNTVGLNWYLNPYSRVMWNYIHSNSEFGASSRGAIDCFAMRLQLDF